MRNFVCAYVWTDGSENEEQEWVSREQERLDYFSNHHLTAFAAAKSLQSCPTLCDPRDGSPPCTPTPGILQARTLEWVAISYSNAWKWKVKLKSLSHVWLLVTPWTAAYQAPPSMGFSRQEYWSGVTLPSPLQLLSGFKIHGSPFHNDFSWENWKIILIWIIMKIIIVSQLIKS